MTSPTTGRCRSTRNLPLPRTTPGFFLLVALLTSPARADDVIDVERAELVTDGGVVAVDGGAWVSTPRLVTLAQERVQCREENKALKASAGVVEARVIVAVVLVSLLAGAGVGYGLAQLPRR